MKVAGLWHSCVFDRVRSTVFDRDTACPAPAGPVQGNRDRADHGAAFRSRTRAPHHGAAVSLRATPDPNSSMEHPMEPRSYVSSLAKGWIIILVCALVGAAAGLALALSREDVYEAESSAFLAVDEVESGSDLWQTTNATVALAKSYSELVTTPTVTGPAAQEVGGISPEQLSRSLTATVPLESVNITITAQDGDPERAAAMANAALDALVAAVDEVAPSTGEGNSAVSLYITQEATAPAGTSGLSTALLVALGAAAGLALGAVLALLRTPTRHEPVAPAQGSATGPDAAPRP